MNIAWCTPFATRSRIGEFGAAVMTEGLGVITVDFGPYAEMPDDTVLRIDYPPSPDQLSHAIRSAIGEYVRAHHTAGHYADVILEVIKKAGSLGRRSSEHCG
jgi:hypothetical protein